MSVYRVVGPFRYRDTDIGATFETNLDPDVEARALKLGAIEVLDPTPVTLRPGSWRLPDWHTSRKTRGPEGPLSLRGASSG